MVRLLKLWCLCTVEGYRPSYRWTILEHRLLTWKIIFQGYRMIVNAVGLGYFCHERKRRDNPNTWRGSWRGPHWRRARQFVLGKKDKHSWPPRSSPRWMTHTSQSFIIGPQGHSHKFLWIKEFHPLGFLQPCKFSRRVFCKPYGCLAEGEEKHPRDHLCSGVGHQKGLLEESNLSQFVLERKSYHAHRGCPGYCDHPGHRDCSSCSNRHGYCDCSGCSNRHGYCDRPSSFRNWTGYPM